MGWGSRGFAKPNTYIISKEAVRVYRAALQT